MGIIEETFVKAKEVIDVAGKKTSEVIAVQKLKVNAASLQSQLAKDYEALGRLVYTSAREGTKHEEAAEELMAEIDGKRIRLKNIRAEIAHVRGDRLCPSCGAANAPVAVFCNKCGEKLQPAAGGTAKNGAAKPSEEAEAKDAGDNPFVDAEDFDEA